jgi:hypothetical protein
MDVSFDESELTMWPNFFLVGAPKCGTTSIAGALEQHRDVFPVIVKEPNFFNADLRIEDAMTTPKLLVGRVGKRHHAVIRDESAYLRLYEQAGAYKAVGDYSVNYLRSKVAPRAIRARVPHAQIIVILRNPIERAFSHFLMDCRIGRVNDPFGVVLDRHIRDVGRAAGHYENYIEGGLYADQIRRYVEVFGRDKVLILLYDDVVADFLDAVQRIFEHIGVWPIDIDTVATNRAMVAKSPSLNFLLNKSGLKELIRRHVPRRLKDEAKKIYYEKSQSRLGDTERSRLAELYRDDIGRVAAFIGRDLDHWLREPSGLRMVG